MASLQLKVHGHMWRNNDDTGMFYRVTAKHHGPAYDTQTITGKRIFCFSALFFPLSLLFLGTELFGSLCVCEHGHVTLKLIRMVSFRQSMNAIILVYCIIFCIWCLLQWLKNLSSSGLEVHLLSHVRCWSKCQNIITSHVMDFSRKPTRSNWISVLASLK